MSIKLFQIASRCLLILTIATIDTIDLVRFAPLPASAETQYPPGFGEAIEKYSQGLKLVQSGDFTEALSTLKVALKMFEKIGDRRYQGKVMGVICIANAKLDRQAEALDFCQKSLAIARESSDKKEITRVASITSKILLDIGIAEQKQQNNDRALKSLLAAKALAGEVGNLDRVALILIYLGATYTSLAEYPAAIRSFSQSIELYQQLSNIEKVAEVSLLQGDAYYYSAQYSQALKNYEFALKTSREIKNETVEVSALLRLAGVNDSLAQYQQSVKLGEEALALARKMGSTGFEATILNGLGSSSTNLGKYLEARTYLVQSLEIYLAKGDRSQAQLVLANLGKVAYKLNEIDRSLSYYQQASENLTDKRLAASILDSVGDIYYYAQGQNQRALANYQQAANLAHSINAADIEGIALSNQGKVLYSLGKLPAAEIQLRAAIKIWESLRVGLNDKNKVSFAEAVAPTYQLLQKVLIEQNKIQAALEISERARARALAELLASKLISTSSANANKIRQAPSLIQIQQVANAQKATLVQYSVIDNNIYIWVVKPTGKITFHQTKLPAQTTLKDLVIATRDSVGANRGRRSKDDSPKTTGGDLKQLHKLLIAPIAQDLPSNPEERVIILPQNELFLVPFAALQDAQGQYLIQQHTLTIAPSIQVLALTERKSGKSSTPPLVVGNPIMPLYKGEQLANLAGAEAEAKGIAKILQVEPLIGAAADRQKVIDLMQRAPIIHLATHGLLDTIKGDIPGAIALTNGFLTSGEIFDMELSADLVVLSACDTGRGDLTGEGVVGLSRSLSVAGVPSVLVSLWEVSDEATKALMEEFYHNLRDKKLPKAQALRQAMLTTMKAYPDPNLWAAFMLVGEGR